MIIFKATSKKDHVVANSNIKAISLWEDKAFRMFIDGEKTALYSIEISKWEAERIVKFIKDNNICNV